MVTFFGVYLNSDVWTDDKVEVHSKSGCFCLHVNMDILESLSLNVRHTLITVMEQLQFKYPSWL